MPVTTRREGVEQLRPGMPGYRARLPEAIHPISAGIKGGIIGGLVMPLPAFLYGLVSHHGIWYPGQPFGWHGPARHRQNERGPT